MSKLLAIVGILKGILVAASVAFALGDMLAVILISILLNLVELGAKPGSSGRAARHRRGLAAPRSISSKPPVCFGATISPKALPLQRAMT